MNLVGPFAKRAGLGERPWMRNEENAFVERKEKENANRVTQLRYFILKIYRYT